MKSSEEYFTIPELITVNGCCHQFISASETTWRSIETYEEPPF